MWLCIPEGKPIWHVKILHRESHYQNNGQNITIQTNVKTSHSQSHWQKMIIGCIFFLNFKKHLSIWQSFKSIHVDDSGNP